MKYYIAVDNHPEGPFDLSELSSQNVKPDTLLWCEGMPQWKQASEIAEVRTLLFPSMPAIPPAFDSQKFGRTEIPTPKYEPQPQYRECPKSYLAQAILCTIFCCVPLGIVAIVYAAQVESNWAKGFYDEAEKKSDNARQFVNWSFWLGLIGSIIYFFLNLATLNI